MDTKPFDDDHNIKEHDTGVLSLDKSTIKDVDGDDVWKFLGRLGRYQKWQIFLAFLISTTLSFPILSGLFVGKNVDFKCAGEPTDLKIPPNASLELSTCSKKIVDRNTSRVLSEAECTDYHFGNNTALSYIAEWKLVCGDETLGNLPQTLTMVGMAIGASTLPQIGDKFGRKKLLVGCIVLLSGVNIALAFVPQFELFVVLKFLSGALNQGFMVPINVVLLEILPTDMRSVAGFLAMSFWVMSCVVTGIIGYVMREFDWRMMQVTFGSISAAVVLLICFLDESLRWLLGNSKVSEATAVIKKACRMNNKDYQELINHALRPNEENGKGEPGTHHVLLSPLDKQDSVEKTKAEEESTLISMLKNQTMRRISLIMCYTWMTCALSYYGLILLSTSLAGDPYVNYFIGAVSEWPSGVLMTICIQKFGRKKTLISFQFISAVSLICAVLVANTAPSDNVYATLQTAFTITGKFFVAGSFNLIWIYTPEMYPTNIRNIGIGMSSASARVGATFSPFITMLARKAMWAPGALFAAGCILSAFLLTLVPETRWRELPRSIADIEEWVQDDKKSKGDNEKHPDDDV